MHRLTVKCSLFFLLLIPLSVFSQTIDNIEVKGNYNFSEEDYSSWINIDNTKFFNSTIDTVRVRVAANLEQNGYFNYNIISVNPLFSPDSQHVTISINLSEGLPTYINRIIVDNSDSLKQKDIPEFFSVLENSPFIISELETVIEKLIVKLENSGFPFASVNIGSLFFFYDSISNENRVDLFLEFQNNRSSTIDSITIVGNSKTKDYVIKRELRFNKKEVYSQKKIEEIPAHLNRLHFFNPVHPPKYFFNSQNKGILQIEVEEKNTNSFDGLIGYIPSTKENENGYITGLVNINLRNLFGTGRAFAFKWSKLDRYSQELELKYLEPWIFGLPFNIDLEIFQRQQDSTYVQRNLGVNIEFLATQFFSASLTFSNYYTIPTNPTENGFTVFNSVATNSGVNFKYDSRDDIFVPKKGFYLLSAFKYSAKNINGPAQFVSDSTNTSPKQYRIELDMLFFKSFFIRHIPFIGLHIRELAGDDIELSDMYRIGGNNTLRGYQENQFLGNRIIWTNLEYRYLLGLRSYAFLFTDIAYYKRNQIPSQNMLEFSATKIGYGVGITFETGLGMLAVSYALAEGDTFNKGKIHFGLIGEF